jgi:hypothetical protein
MQTNITGSTVLPSPEQISAAIIMARMEVGRQELGIRQIFKGFTDRAAKAGSTADIRWRYSR